MSRRIEWTTELKHYKDRVKTLTFNWERRTNKHSTWNIKDLWQQEGFEILLWWEFSGTVHFSLQLHLGFFFARFFMKALRAIFSQEHFDHSLQAFWKFCCTTLQCKPGRVRCVTGRLSGCRIAAYHTVYRLPQAFVGGRLSPEWEWRFKWNLRRKSESL